jgi:hypothetical protein
MKLLMKTEMKKTNVFLVVIGLILVVAVLTNPNQDRHKEVIRSKFNSYMQKSMSDGLSKSQNEWEQAGQVLGMMLGGALIDGIISNIVTTDNYVIFSTTKINWEGESKVIGVGLFGNVFLTSKIDEALDEGLLAQ